MERVARVFFGDQHLDRFVVEAGFPIHFGQLPIRLRFKSATHRRLQGNPPQAALHVDWGARAEAVVGEAVNQQIARPRPALLLIEQHANTGAGQINDRAVLKLNVAPKQEG